MDFLIIFFIIALIVLILYLIFQFKKEEEYVKASDDNFYLLRNLKLENPEYQTIFKKQSAETLAKINTNIITLLDFLNKNHSDKYWVKKLNSNYKRNGKSLSEASVDNGFTSFTIDKEYMHICLRTRDSKEQLYDINTLMYVVIHELAHMANYSKSGSPIEGHGPEFIDKFKFLLQKSIDLGIYRYQDYAKSPKEYCGITIYKNVL